MPKTALHNLQPLYKKNYVNTSMILSNEVLASKKYASDGGTNTLNTANMYLSVLL